MADFKQTLSAARWHCAPPAWELTEDMLTVTTGKETDFWQSTFYGFRRDDGHFLGLEVAGDFSAIVTFEADYEVLYDQAGLMMRSDSNTWLKAGIEYSDDVTNFSTFVTRAARSDWSVIGVPKMTGPQSILLTRLGGAVLTHYLAHDGQWQLMRLADFPENAAVTVGPMACSPQREGLVVRFHKVDIGPPVDNPLHAE